MTKLSLHAASAPIFATLLNNLNTWLDKAEAHAAAKKFDVEALLSARLVADMLPLKTQIWFAAAFAKNTMCRLAGETPPDYPGGEPNVAELRALIARTLDIVNSVSPTAVDASEGRPITFGMGPEKKMTLSGTDFLLRFSLPNFYFHVTTAYNILRENGVELGKQDFVSGMFEMPA